MGVHRLGKNALGVLVQESVTELNLLAWIFRASVEKNIVRLLFFRVDRHTRLSLHVRQLMQFGLLDVGGPLHRLRLSAAHLRERNGCDKNGGGESK